MLHYLNMLQTLPIEIHHNIQQNPTITPPAQLFPRRVNSNLTNNNASFSPANRSDKTRRTSMTTSINTSSGPKTNARTWKGCTNPKAAWPSMHSTTCLRTNRFPFYKLDATLATHSLRPFVAPSNVFNMPTTSISTTTATKSIFRHRRNPCSHVRFRGRRPLPQ